MELLRFVEKSDAFDNNSKLKLILLLAGVKPNAYIHLRIQKNLHDKHIFEDLLKECGVLYKVGRAKGYEEIVKIKKNSAAWKIKGMWYGYDLFKDKKEKEKFARYVSLIKKGKHKQADTLGGSLYGYPACCVKNFIEEHDLKSLKKYTAYQYYKRLNDSDKKYPFIAHTPCKITCKLSSSLNKKYKAAVRKHAPKFYKEYSKKKTYNVPIIVDIDYDMGVKWKKVDGHDYSVISQKPINGRYYIMSWLTKKKYKRGDVLSASVTIQYDYATIKIKKKIDHLKNFHHERRFTKL